MGDPLSDHLSSFQAYGRGGARLPTPGAHSTAEGLS
jgi:hypothetical protein